MNERYFWKSHSKDIEQFVKRCDVCQKANPKNAQPAALLHPIAVNQIFERWGIDCIGPLALTDQGNRYIISAVEYLTKWCEAAAVPAINGAATCEFLLDLISRFGCPEIILSDQGREFCNHVNDFLCKTLQIERHVAQAYHPQVSLLL